MHYAHKLLEALKPDSEDYGRVMRAVKFDLGDYEAAERMASLSTRSFWRAPFPVCLFQWSEGPRVHLLLTWQDDDSLTVRCFYRNESTGFAWNQSSFDFRVNTAGDCAFISGKGEDITDWVVENDKEGFFLVMTDLAQSLEVFSCCNVEQVEHAAPKHLNAQRARKNKPPMFSFRTLHLTGEAAPHGAARATGDRTSPRLHLRRGHIRRLLDGRRVWVRSAVVGAKGSGFVHKDYAVHLGHNVGAGQRCGGCCDGRVQARDNSAGAGNTG